MTELVAEQIVVRGIAFSLLRPTDPEALIDERSFEEDEFLPYWAELWPSSIALAHVVAGLELEGRPVLELGCGLALPSLVAAAGGASVVASDWSEDAVVLVARNAATNGVSVRSVCVGWTDTHALDEETFDVVLAADVLYEARNVAPLVRAIDRFLRADGEALVVDPGRRHAAHFADAARDAGWHVWTTDPPSLPRGQLYRLRRPD